MQDIWKVCGAIYLAAVALFFSTAYETIWWVGGIGELERMLFRLSFGDWAFRGALLAPGLLLLFWPRKRDYGNGAQGTRSSEHGPAPISRHHIDWQN